MKVLAIIVCIVGSLGAYLYVTDSRAVTQAKDVKAYLIRFCERKERYPNYLELLREFPIFEQDDWFYWPSDDLERATFQYPMTLPLPNAPGRSKISEFIPVIYSYAVVHPCKRKTSFERFNKNKKTLRDWYDPPLGDSWTFTPKLVRRINDKWELWATTAVQRTNSKVIEKRGVFLYYVPAKFIYRFLDRGEQIHLGCRPHKFHVDLPTIRYERKTPEGQSCTPHVYYADLPDDGYLKRYVCGPDPECEFPRD